MRTTTAVFAAALGLALAAAPAARAEVATVGQPAPDFMLKDSNGQSHALSSLKGKWVVLEWINYDCPFVQKHYRSGNMPKLQKEYTAKGVVWLAVNSSNVGKQGYFEPAEIKARSQKEGLAASAYLVDTDGAVGRLYGAKTTPHMYVITPEGKLVYAGGIDDTPSTDQADIATAKNYVRAALDEAMAGKAVTKPTSQPYGCSVKY
jgi:peroxiredoxin